MDEMREGESGCGRGLGSAKEKKENSRDPPDQCKDANGMSVVKTPEAASTCEKWRYCARNGVSG